MREILFRGKRVDNGEWVEGSLVPITIDCYDKGYEIIDNDGIEYDELDYYNPTYCSDRVIPETVGQFIGLTDKNGKKIFEGDIVAHRFFKEERIDGVVKYGTFNCSCCNGVYGWYIDGGDIRSLEMEYDEDITPCYVIGNCIDNPELLKEGAE